MPKSAEPKGLFRYREDLQPVFWMLLLFTADLLVFFLSPAWWVSAIWLVAGIFPKACICSYGHHHQHLPTFHSSALNRLLEIILAFHTGITSQAWFLHHVLGHHRHYMDQTLDESRWQRSDGSKMGATEYSLSVAITGYPRAWMAGTKVPKRRLLFAAMLALQIALLAGLFWYNWVNALLVFALPMAVSLYITAWHTYYHHAGLETDNPYEASYNILHTWYNKLTCNLGYHTAHHLKCAVHWSRLPALHDEIRDKIPANLYREPCFPFSLMGKSSGCEIQDAGSEIQDAGLEVQEAQQVR